MYKESIFNTTETAEVTKYMNYYHLTFLDNLVPLDLAHKCQGGFKMPNLVLEMFFEALK